MSETSETNVEGQAVNPSHLTFDLQRSIDSPSASNSRAGRYLYNVIDWTGQHRGQIALSPEEACALDPLMARAAR